MSKRQVKIVPPEVFSDNFQIVDRKEKAVGIPAVTSSMKHIAEEIGMIKGLKLIAKMNQKGGFDCSGCAWPDPDDKRSSLGDYCENGEKTLAEEATTKRVTKKIFEQYCVEEMANWRNNTNGKTGRMK